MLVVKHNLTNREASLSRSPGQTWHNGGHDAAVLLVFLSELYLQQFFLEHDRATMEDPEENDSHHGDVSSVAQYQVANADEEAAQIQRIAAHREWTCCSEVR